MDTTNETTTSETMTEREWVVWQGAYQSVLDASSAGGTKKEGQQGNLLAARPRYTVRSAVEAANTALDLFRKVPARASDVSGDADDGDADDGDGSVDD